MSLNCDKGAKAMYIFMGGTVDPVHKGHLRGARHVSALYGNAVVHLLPTKLPVHKAAPNVTNSQRLDMLSLAALEYREISIDLREINADTASYTIDTLKQLRREIGHHCSLVMVIGIDSFITLPQWRDYQQFLELCHILVFQRPNYSIAENGLNQALLLKRVEDAKQLVTSCAGKLFFLEQPNTNVSASEIRTLLAEGNKSELLPKAVAQYIDQHKLYQEISA